MSEFPDRFETPEDAYFGFFRADSAKNAPAWAACMSYPHVRVSARGRVVYYDTPEQYAADADWTPREATGWVRSEGIEPTRLHESADKVHLLGGWTRFNAQNEQILHNRVTYIVTKIDDSWGIQARFGVDSFTGELEADSAAKAESVVNQFISSMAEANYAASAQMCREPLTIVGVGSVECITGEREKAAVIEASSSKNEVSRDVKAIESGSHGAIVEVAVKYADSPSKIGIAIVGKQEEQWQIAGLSRVWP